MTKPSHTNSTIKLQARPEDRHSSVRHEPLAAPVIVVILSVVLVVSCALAFWIYRLQRQQNTLQDRVASQVADVIERMDLSGIDRESSLEDVGLSLKALNDRQEELWKLAGDVHVLQLRDHGDRLKSLKQEQQNTDEDLVTLQAELGALSGLIANQKDQLGGALAGRVQEAGRAAAELELNQKKISSRLGKAEIQLTELAMHAQSMESYRRTTNKAVLRLETRLTLLESQSSESEEAR
ncbi:MAG: hypothetical protein ACR2PW_00195 [Gammaproteobacteria bacterium]